MDLLSPSAAGLVAELMTGPAPIVPGHLTMAAARKIAGLKSVAQLLVEDGGAVTGVLDERALAVSGDSDPVSMWAAPLRHAVRPTTTIARAHTLLVQQAVSWLPVVAGVFVVGSVSREALERALARAAARQRTVAPLAA